MSFLSRIFLPTKSATATFVPKSLLLHVSTLAGAAAAATSTPAAATSTPATSPAESTTLSILMSTFGLSFQSALAASRKIELKPTTVAPTSHLKLYRDFGLTDAQIAKIIAKQPTVLLHSADNNFRPKLEFLRGFGFSDSSLARLVTAEPIILKRSLENHLIPFFRFLLSILQNEKNVVAACTVAPRSLHANLRDTVIPGIQALRDHGLPEPRIFKLIMLQPGVLIYGPKRVDTLVAEVKRTGLLVSDGMFIFAYGTICGLAKPTWERKMAVYKSFGLSEDQVLSAFRKLPNCMKSSEERINQAMEFYVNRLKLRPADVIAHPKLLMPSLEKTIVPRCTVLSVLLSKGKIKEDARLVSALTLSSRFFVKRYIEKHRVNVPEVLMAYNGEMEFKGLDLKL